jgi:D-beta-D-heptose 7-phosphate kinase/D-beta-D-heptose 1-phosphate adenosyltransferase
VRQWKSRGFKVGFTNGCFDVLHSGHVALLSAASEQCVRRLKGDGRPFYKFSDRAAVIAALEVVDAVVGFDEDTPLDLIRRLLPDVLMKGADWTIDTVIGREEVEAIGGRVELIDLVEGYSTTEIIDRMRASTPAKADA